MVVPDTQYILAHSTRRGGAQYYQKTGMTLTWIRRRVNWSKHEHSEQYLEYSNHEADQSLDIPLATAMYFSSQGARQKDLILYNIANVLSKPCDGKPATQLRDEVLIAIGKSKKQKNESISKLCLTSSRRRCLRKH